MDHGCVLLYLTMDPKSDSQEKDELLYKFPADEDSALEDMRGLFITISHLLLEVTGNTATESALLLDEEWVHVGYSRENREVLVVAVPANKLLLCRLPHMMRDIVRLLKLLYGSLHGAFTYPGNRFGLDHIFSQLFEHISMCGLSEDLEDPHTSIEDPQVSVEDLLGHSLSAARMIFLPEHTKVTVSNCLSQLEAADFADMVCQLCHNVRAESKAMTFYKGNGDHDRKEGGMEKTGGGSEDANLSLWTDLTKDEDTDSDINQLAQTYNDLATEGNSIFYFCPQRHFASTPLPVLTLSCVHVQSEDYYDMRRLYNILGTCLFYQDHLVANHLETEDLIDIALYARHTGACYNENLVVWTEVFPTSRCHQQMEPLVPGYIPPTDARWFLVLVSLKSCMLGMLLESSSCMSYSDGGADCFYIDHAKATLLQLETVGLSQACHSSLHCYASPGGAALSRARATTPSGPRVTSTPLLPKSHKPGREVPASPRQGDDDIDSVATNGSDISSHRCHVSYVNSCDESGDIADNSHLFKGCQGRRNLLSLDEAVRLESTLCDSRGHAGCDSRLAAHSEGSLLYYTQLHNQQGVFVCPSHPAAPGSVPGMGRQFHQACLAIHELFQQAQKIRDFKESGHRSKFGVDDVFADAVEYGIMLECPADECTDLKRPTTKQIYWVVGRLLHSPEPRELVEQGSSDPLEDERSRVEVFGAAASRGSVVLLQEPEPASALCEDEKG
ncbi:Protein inturned [Lamellibrachia satsuma]|nr:Protein inturned [Lamellibrachia satsuma]